MSGEEIIPVCAVQLGKNFCLYFADDDELECDALCEEKIFQHRVFRNVNRQLLVFRPDLQLAAFENVTDQEMKCEGFERPSHTNWQRNALQHSLLQNYHTFSRDACCIQHSDTGQELLHVL